MTPEELAETLGIHVASCLSAGMGPKFHVEADIRKIEFEGRPTRYVAEVSLRDSPADFNGETRSIQAYFPEELLSDEKASLIIKLTGAEIANRLRNGLISGANICFAQAVTKESPMDLSGTSAFDRWSED